MVNMDQNISLFDDWVYLFFSDHYTHVLFAYLIIGLMVLLTGTVFRKGKYLNFALGIALAIAFIGLIHSFSGMIYRFFE